MSVLKSQFFKVAGLDLHQTKPVTKKEMPKVIEKFAFLQETSKRFDVIRVNKLQVKASWSECHNNRHTDRE